MKFVKMASGFSRRDVLALGLPVKAQQSGKVPKIGLLTGASTAVAAPLIDAFRQGLLESGYIEGKNIILEIRGVRQNPIDFPIWRLSWSV